MKRAVNGIECFRYNAFDLTLRSSISLDLPPSTNTISDLEIGCSKESTKANIDLPDVAFQVGPQKGELVIKNVGIFSFSEGQKIWITPFKDCDSELLAHAILGTPLGIILLQRGCLVLHASAVNVDGKVICFVGKSGAGKSTAICSLIRAGYRLVADDVVAINTNENYNVLPAYPWMKVSGELIERLNLSRDCIEPLERSGKKFKYRVSIDEDFGSTGHKLAAIFCLNWGDTVVVRELLSAEALLNVIAHEYGYVPKAEHPLEEEARFLRTAALVKNTPIFSIVRPKDFDMLHQAAEKILETVRSL